MAATLSEIIVDCDEPSTLAEFWGKALGCDVQRHDTGALWISPPNATGTGPLLVFVAARGPRSGPNRLRLYLTPSGCGRDDEVARLVSLGARPVDTSTPWAVLADPEGNEFSVAESASS